MRLLLFLIAAALLVGAVGTGYCDVAGIYHALTPGQRALPSASAGLSGGVMERAVAGDLDLNQSCAELGTAAGAFTDATTGIGEGAGGCPQLRAGLIEIEVSGDGALHHATREPGARAGERALAGGEGMVNPGDVAVAGAHGSDQ